MEEIEKMGMTYLETLKNGMQNQSKALDPQVTYQDFKKDMLRKIRQHSKALKSKI